MYEYINDFERILSFFFFTSFKIIVCIFTIILILSLIILAIGCVIKSQKIKSSFLKLIPQLLLALIFVLLLPYLFLQFKNLI